LPINHCDPAAARHGDGIIANGSPQETRGRNFLMANALGRRIPILFFVGVADKYEWILTKRLHISSRGVSFHFRHQIGGFVFGHVLGGLPEFIGKKPNTFALIDFRHTVRN
jgi:hypothetical protein